MLWDHTRRDYKNDKNIILPIGKINNLSQEGESWTGDPEFDQDDEFARTIGKKYDKGYINAASIGADIIEMSTDPALMLPGQTGPTITKWVLKEISLTDIPANADAVKLNYQGKSITLNGKDKADFEEFFKPNNQSMKKVIAALNGSKLVQLTEASTEELVAEAVTTLTNQIGAKDQTIAAKDAEIANLKTQVNAAKTAALSDKATALVDAAIAGKKIVAAQKDNLVKLASQSEESYNGVKGMLDSMAGFTSPTAAITSTGGDELPASTALRAKAFDEHMEKKTLSKLSKDNVVALYEAKFGKKPADAVVTNLMNDN